MGVSDHVEWMRCLPCGARWSRTTGADDIQIKVALPMAQPQSMPPCPGCVNKEDVVRMQSVPSVQKDGSTTYYGSLCVTVCALMFGGATFGESGNANERPISQFGGEFHVERSNRVTTRAGVLVGATSISFVLESQFRKLSEQSSRCSWINSRRSRVKRLQATMPKT